MTDSITNPESKANELYQDLVLFCQTRGYFPLYSELNVEEKALRRKVDHALKFGSFSSGQAQRIGELKEESEAKRRFENSFDNRLASFYEKHGRLPKENVADSEETTLFRHFSRKKNQTPLYAEMKAKEAKAKEAERAAWPDEVLANLILFCEENGRFPRQLPKDTSSTEHKLATQVNNALRKERFNAEQVATINSLKNCYRRKSANPVEMAESLKVFWKEHRRNPSQTNGDDMERQLAFYFTGGRNLDKLPAGLQAEIRNGLNKYGRGSIQSLSSEIESFIEENGRFPLSSKTVSDAERKLARRYASAKSRKALDQQQIEKYEKLRKEAVLEQRLESKSASANALLAEVAEFKAKHGRAPEKRAQNDYERKLARRVASAVHRGSIDLVDLA